MSETTHTADRLLRFADLTLAGGAIPLPVSLVPSALPSEAVPEVVAPEQAVGDQAPPNDTPIFISPPHDVVVPDEAVLNSVSAALDAVRVSLQDVTQAADVHLAEAPLSHVKFPGTLVSVAVADDAAVEPMVMGPTATAPTAIASSIPVPDAVAQALPHADTLVSAVTQVVDGVTDTVEDVVEGVVHAVDAVVDGVVGNVLVPTLNGLGLDILNGLVPAPPQSASANDAAVAEPHNAAVFDAIGLETGIADHDVAHTPHAPQHLVGSGLI